MKAAVPRPGHPARPAGDLPLLGQPAAPRRGGVQLRGGLHATGPQDIISVLPAGGSGAAVLRAAVLCAAVLCAAVLHVQATWKGEMPRCVAAEAETGRVWCEESADTACQQLCYLQGEGTHDTCRHVTREACRRGAALRLPPRLHPVRGRPHV